MGGEVNGILALTAGVLSFLSPCVLPLIPSYLSFISGVEFRQLGEVGLSRRRVVVRTLYFVLGFTIVFVALGILFSGPALLFRGIARWINFVAGMVVVVLGLNVIFDFLRILNFERRLHAGKRPQGAIGTIVVGMAFGAGWSPCIGPILASILLLAGSEGQILHAGMLLFIYSIGLGLPFIVTGLAFDRATGYLQRIKRHFSMIRVVSGLFLVVTGLLIMFGRFQQLNGWLSRSGYLLQGWAETQAPLSTVLFGVLPITIGAIPVAVPLIRTRSLRALPTIMGGILIGTGTLHVMGVINVARMIGSWFLYQGI